ncbi:MAG: hypothetical protein GX352_03215 [Clostridiales bacterium]|nr:hypothetical protein [Clostridiales bacterium]
MATQITNYQCPACTGPLHFSSASGKLECEYCDKVFEVAAIEELYAEKDRLAAEAQSEADYTMEPELWSDEEAANMRAYSCPSCGAELICDHTTAATSCPYCNNPTIVPGQFADKLKPDFVIPFRLDKEAAKKALRHHYKGKKLLPKSFLTENHIEEIKGIYVPFWLFNGESHANISYRGTVVHSRRVRNEMVTTTDHFHIVREGKVAFQRVPADASTKMPDAHMDAIEPYDYADLAPFSTAYLPGYMADKYDVEADDCVERVDKRMRSSTESALASTVGAYATLVTESSNINIKKGDVKYALLPVWMMNTKWKGKDFLFAMNGQTGRLIGDLPVDWSRFWAWFGGISLPLMAIMAILMFFVIGR